MKKQGGKKSKGVFFKSRGEKKKQKNTFLKKFYVLKGKIN